MLQCKGCGLFPRFFVRVITVDTEALACFGIIKEEETRMRLFLFYTFSRFCRQRLIASMTAA